MDVPRYAPDPLVVNRLPNMLGDGRTNHGGLTQAESLELRSLIREWFESEANWPLFVERRLKSNKRIPFREGKYYLQTSEPPVLVPMPSDGSTHVEAIFLQFILAPDHKRLGGPCKCGCGRYFLRKTVKPKSFVDGHAQHATALKAANSKRLRLLEQRVSMVTKITKEYARRGGRGDWKMHVEYKTGITPRTLSGWVNKGYITAPAERKGKA